MNVNKVSIELSNPIYPQIYKDIVNGYFEHIDTSVCIDLGVNMFYSDPIITIIDDISQIGHNMMYYILKIENRDLYSELKNNKILTLDQVSFSMIERLDYKILVIDFNKSDKYDLLKRYHDRLLKYSKTDQSDEFYINMTVTYLKKNAPDDMIQDINAKLINESMRMFEITNFTLFLDDGQRKKIQIRG